MASPEVRAPRVRSVNVLVRDPDGRTLLQMRDASTAIFPLLWGFWGGAMSPLDATAADCAAREIREELELAATAGDFRRVGLRTASTGEAWLMLYARPVRWGDFRVREGAGAGFFWRNEILRLPLSKPVADHLRADPSLFGEAGGVAAQSRAGRGRPDQT